jgi:hypothetical protein
MKKTVGVWEVVGLLAGLVYGGDDFNDGIRNKVLWKVPAGNSGKFVETNTRLYFNSMGDAGFRAAEWYWKTPYTLYSGDRFVASILITFPKITLDPSDAIYLGMGLANGSSASAKKLLVTMMDYNSERRISVSVFGGGLVGSYEEFDLPHATSLYYLEMRYTTVTGKMVIWQRGVDNTWATKVCAMNLNSRWQIPLGTPLLLVPYLHGETTDVGLTTSDNFCLDNFSVLQTIP